MTALPDPIAVALRVVQVLDSLDVASTVGGSIAASFAGEPRSTLDIDIVVSLTLQQVPAVVAALRGEFYVDQQALAQAVRRRSSTNLIHDETQLRVDVFVAGGTPLDEQQLRRRMAVDLGSGRVLHVHPPEDILLQKLRWYRLGRGVSDRQWRDVLAIVRTQGARLDRDYLRTGADTLGVADLLARALGDP